MTVENYQLKNNDNLIRRQDAIKAMYRLEAEDIERYGCSIPEGFDAKPAVEALEALPSAELEQKKSEWIKHENPTLGHCMKIIYECSVCHKAVGCEYFIRRSFCPHCGADMRGEQ